MVERYNYYGYDRATYTACHDLISDSNRRHSEIINLWFILVNVLYLVCAHFRWLNVDQRNRPIYLCYIALMLLFFAAMRFIPQIHRYPIIPTVVNIIILSTFGIRVSDAAPYMIAFMYLIIMLVIAMSYIETMLRMTVIQVVCTLAFIYSSHAHKPAQVASEDLSNVIIVLSLALLLHYRFQRNRIAQFITHNQNMEIRRELEVKSSFDGLTSLLNRGSFFAMSAKILQNKARGGYYALALLDLDGFKQINDTHGHQTGDIAIQRTGEAIADVLRMDLSARWDYMERTEDNGASYAGRLGGDEFIMLIRDKDNRIAVQDILMELLLALQRVEIGGIRGLQASVGVTEITPDETDTDIDIAYKRADDALYQSKRGGKGQITFFEK